MKLREREYRSRFDRRDRQPEYRIIEEPDRMPIDIRGKLLKYGPWVAGAAVAFWAITNFLF